MDTKFILAADFLDLSKLEDLIQLPIDAVKIGFALGYTWGLATVVDSIKGIKPDLRIVMDHQKTGTDIPELSKLFARTCWVARINEIIIMPLSGMATLHSLLAACKDYAITPWVGVGMSHAGFPDEDEFFSRATNYLTYIYPSLNTLVAPSKSWLLDQIEGSYEVMVTGIGRQKGDIDATNRLSSRLGTGKVSIVLGSWLYDSKEPEKVIEKMQNI